MIRPVLSKLRAGVLAVALPLAVPAALQAQDAPSLMGTLLADLGQTQQKIMALAETMPEESWDWRPMEGVRSVQEVLQHVIADNYLLPTAVGVEAPAETGITSDYQTAVTFEAREMTHDEIMDGLQSSFDHLRSAMEAEGDDALGEVVNMFGMNAPQQRLWVLTTVHLHEHLGQLIAYARTNEIVPPWSRGGN